jgi:hypothetical protein
MSRNNRILLVVTLVLIAWGLSSVTLGAGFYYTENFEGTSVGSCPWGVGWRGGTMGVTNARSFGVGTKSLHMKSIALGDCAYAVGPWNFALDFTKNYGIQFDFNYDTSYDPNLFHFIEVWSMNGPTWDNNVGLFLDTPGQANGWDGLIYRTSNGNTVIAGLTQNTWYSFDIAVKPATSTYDVTLTDPTNNKQIYDPVTMLTVNSLTIANIPFIGTGQAVGFFPFELGDPCSVDTSFFTHGEAYWDNVTITGEVPEPSTLVLLSIVAVGLLAPAWRRRKQTLDT